jgi:hypothetical protein
MALSRDPRGTNSPSIDLSAMEAATNEEKPVPVNGYQQVVEMLAAADPAFRESLLTRISQRNPELGRSLRRQFN